MAEKRTEKKANRKRRGQKDEPTEVERTEEGWSRTELTLREEEQ